MTLGRIFSFRKTADACIWYTLMSKRRNSKEVKTWTQNPGAWKPRRSFLELEATSHTTINALAGSEIIGNYSNLGQVHCVSVDPWRGCALKNTAGPADKVQTRTKSSQGSACSLDVTEPCGACWERSRFIKFTGGTRKRGCQTARGRHTAGGCGVGEWGGWESGGWGIK